MRIGLVTDSTAQLSASEREELSEATGGLFAVVPLTVLIGGVAFADGEVDAFERLVRAVALAQFMDSECFGHGRHPARSGGHSGDLHEISSIRAHRKPRSTGESVRASAAS